MFADYRTLVLRDYQEKSVRLPRLANPSPAQLRDECIAVFDERYDKKDDQILRTFFGPYSDKAACREKIELCEIDKFRPLVKFLKDPDIDTNLKNIDLLAWLIDFQLRPFDRGKKYDLGNPKGQDNHKVTQPEEEQDVIMGTPNGQTAPPVNVENIPSPVNSGNPENISRRKMIILAVVITIVVGLGTYLWAKRKAPSIALTGHEKCMYWAGDHYEPVSCSQKMGNTLVVGLDSERLNHFRRITETDTITLRSVGVVGCVKVKGTVEFYTSSGSHPIETQLWVRPATGYMITKYAIKQ